MSIKLAGQTVAKTSAEIKKVNFEFASDIASGESISSVVSTAVSPTGELTAVAVEGTTTAQVTLGSGLAETAFTGASSTDTLTATGHSLSNNHPVHVLEDDAESLPGGLDTEEQYYVVNAAANTLQLALTPGGSAVSLRSDGQGTLGVDYTVTVTISTTGGQTIVGKGVCQLRD